MADKLATAKQVAELAHTSTLAPGMYFDGSVYRVATSDEQKAATAEPEIAKPDTSSADAGATQTSSATDKK